MKTKICKWCGKTYTPKIKSNRNVTFCNVSCNRASANKTRKIRRQTDQAYRELINKQQRDQYQRAKKDRRKTAKAYMDANRDKINAQKREYYHKNKDKPEVKEAARRNSAKSFQKHKKKILARQAQREKTDVQYYLRKRTRSRISNAIRYYVKGLRKCNGTVELLGCSLSFFKQHLEKQFTKGMSWDEVLKGNIHLDHIKSCWSFDLSQVEEQKKCFNYKNVQPLWACDNLTKNRF